MTPGAPAPSRTFSRWMPAVAPASPARAWRVDPSLLDGVRTARDLVHLVARQPRLADTA